MERGCCSDHSNLFSLRHSVQNALGVLNGKKRAIQYGVSDVNRFWNGIGLKGAVRNLRGN